MILNLFGDKNDRCMNVYNFFVTVRFLLQKVTKQGNQFENVLALTLFEAINWTNTFQKEKSYIYRKLSLLSIVQNCTQKFQSVTSPDYNSLF